MTGQGLFQFFFPFKPRQFAGRRWIKIALRGVHVLCAGLLVGAYLFHAAPEVRGAWLGAACVSGLLVLLLDLHETAVFLVQVRGLVVLLKLAVLASLPWLGGLEAYALGFLVFLSVVSSHASSKVRYRILIGAGRLKGAESKG